MSAKEYPWLRLVYDAQKDFARESREIIHPEQLELPLSAFDVAVVLDVDHIKHDEFRAALGRIKPRWIFDVRAAPRFDNLTVSRVHAFSYFEELGSRYFDIFGSLKIDNYRKAVYDTKRWTKVIEYLLRSFENHEGPYLALADDDRLIEKMSLSLASSLSDATGRNITICHYQG